MKKTPPETIKQVRREQSERKRLEKRIARLTNAAIAANYGLSLRTVQRIERGELS